MKILVICPYVPYPLHGGAPTRMSYVMRGLSSHGHDITLLTGKRESDLPPNQTRLAEFTERIEAYPVRSPAGWREWLQKVVAIRPYPAPVFATESYRSRLAELLVDIDPDLVLANFLFMAAEPARITNSDTKVVLDQHEDEVRHWRGYLAEGRIHERVFAGLTLAKVHRLQSNVFSSVDALAAVSEEEAGDARSRAKGQTPVWIVPNGVDVDRYASILRTRARDGRNLLFVGGMGVKRNADAARWFVRDIFPNIRARHPSARFFVVGSSPLREVKALERHAGVVVTGTVADVRPYYEKASVVVVPQRFGAGTKLKVLEAMAAQRPLVTTSNGIKGLHVNPDEHVLLADDAELFGEHVSTLFNNHERALDLAQKARTFVTVNYSWSNIIHTLNARLQGLVDQ